MQALLQQVIPNVMDKLPAFWKAIGDTLLMTVWAGAVSFVLGLVLGVIVSVARPGGILVMDELGFMEAGAEAFTRAVLEALEGDIPVIAAVKHRFDVPFLNAVRAMPKAKRYTVTPESWEALYEELLPLLRQWNRAGQSF